MRKPKKMDQYVSREEAAKFCLSMAFHILEKPATERIKIAASLSYWNDDLLDDNKPKPTVTVDAVTYKTAARPRKVNAKR